MRKVRLLINPRSGVVQSFRALRLAIDRYFEKPDVDVSYQYTQSKADGVAKAQRAVDDHVDTVLVVGGDGTVSTVGRVLVNTDTMLGVIPAGSGNGFARHFGIDLRVAKAVAQMAEGECQSIDVGVVNGVPFFVTCSMAWDAAIVRTFEKFPFRGILPYVFAGVQEFFDYKRQDMHVTFDDGEKLALKQPVILTIANLTQFGGGAVIAPQAKADDGQLEVVSALQRDFPLVLANLARLFDGSIDRIPQVYSRSARGLRVERMHAAPIQLDGELMDMDAKVDVSVMPRALRVLVPRKQIHGRRG
jgi:diacylglycerol kinase (ATP)